jgi:cell division inhibitor SepF
MGVGEAVRGSPQAEVCLVVTHEFDDAEHIAERFRAGIPVIANVQSCEAGVATRLIDFCSGLTYALDGGLQRIDEGLFLLAPHNVELSGEETTEVLERGFFNQV